MKPRAAKEGRAPPEEVRSVVRDLLRAARRLSQYPEGHPSAASAVEAAAASLSRCLRSHGEIALSLSGTSLLLSGVTVSSPSDAEGHLVSDLRKRYVRSLTLRQGVTADDLLSLFRLLGEDPESVRQKGGAKKVLALPEGGPLELEEMGYDRAVTATEAREKGLISRPIREGDEEAVSPDEAKPVIGFERVVDMLDEPESLARLLQEVSGLPWLEEAVPEHVDEGGGLGLGAVSRSGEIVGGSGLGAVSRSGEVVGGSGAGATLAPQQLARLDVQARRAVFVLTQVRDHLLRQGDEDSLVRQRLSKVVVALDPSFRGCLFRTALDESAPGDVLSQAAELMSDKELAETLMPEPGFLTTDTSERMRRALRRCRGRLTQLAPLALDRLKQWALPELLYTNVIELVASEMEREEAAADEAIPLSLAPEQKRAVSAEIITDLLESIEQRDAVAARAEVVIELIAQESDPDRYRSLITELEAAAEEMLEWQLPALAREIVETLREHANNPSLAEWQRRRASLALEHLKKEAVLAKVTSGLESAPAQQAPDYIFLLCLFGRGGARRLVSILADEKQAHLHDAAAEGLASMASEVGGSFQELTASLPWTASARVAARMAASGDEGALRHVAAMLQHRDWRVRRAAVEGLGRAHGRAVQLLVQALKDRDPDVRGVAVAHLASIADASAVEPLLAVACHGGISGENQALRERAVLALGRIGEPATAALEKIVMRHPWVRRKPDDALGVAAARALAQIGGEEARATLTRGAQYATGSVRQACLEALAATELALPEALERDR